MTPNHHHHHTPTLTLSKKKETTKSKNNFVFYSQFSAFFVGQNTKTTLKSELYFMD